MPLVGTNVGVSIGIAVNVGKDASFDGMYRDADAALLEARGDGASRIGHFIRQAANEPRNEKESTSSS
jgi:GGDEF domain-containing protein